MDNKGKILIDGQDTKNITLSSLRKSMSLVSQDIVLFELDPTNSEMVLRRQYLWQCINEINSDNYLHKFLNISV